MRKLAFFLALLLTLSITSAQAIVVSRVTTFQPHTKAEADQVNAEFDNILNAINGNLETDNFLPGSVATSSLATGAVTSDKIADHTITVDDIATNTGAYIYNRRVGCFLNGDQGTSAGIHGFQVLTPCEVVIDGTRAALAATATVSMLDNQDGGGIGVATWHYVYIKANGGTPTFTVSLTKPDLSTAKKIGDSTSRYIGSVRSGDATTAVVFFKTTGNGNEYELLNTITVGYNPTENNLTTSDADVHIVDAPFTAYELLWQGVLQGSASGQCDLTVYPGWGATYPIYSTEFLLTPVIRSRIFNRLLISTSYEASNNCTSAKVRPLGFVDAAWLYR